MDVSRRLPIDVLTVIGKYACLGREIICLSRECGPRWREVLRRVLRFNCRSRQAMKRVEAMGELLVVDGAEAALPYVEERFVLDRRQHVKAKAAEHLTSIAISLLERGRDIAAVAEARRALRLLASQCWSRQMNVRKAVLDATRRLYEVGLEAEVRAAFGPLVSHRALERWMLPDFELIQPMEQWNVRHDCPVSPTRHITVRNAMAVVSLFVCNGCDADVFAVAYVENRLLEPPALVPRGACLRWAYMSNDETGAQHDSYYIAAATPVASTRYSSDESGATPLFGRFVVRGRGAVEVEARRPYRAGFLVERWRYDHDGPKLTVSKTIHEYSDEDWPETRRESPRPYDDDDERLALERELQVCRNRARRLAGQTDIDAAQSLKNAMGKHHLLDDRRSSLSPWLDGRRDGQTPADDASSGGIPPL